MPKLLGFSLVLKLENQDARYKKQDKRIPFYRFIIRIKNQDTGQEINHPRVCYNYFVMIVFSLKPIQLLFLHEWLWYQKLVYLHPILK